ncbi:MAG: VOC family protein [Holophagales bacterium]|nr:VOC family protein [Holophagales bacterium]
MAEKVNPIPEGYRTVTPYIVVKGAAEALDFYAKAFGAEEVVRMPGPGGSVMHAEVKIGDSMLMLSDEFPDWGQLGPISRGGTTCTMMLYVENCDASFQRAVDAGCAVTSPPKDEFWGDRFAKVTDPFGHQWAFATHIEDVSPEEMTKRMAAMGMGG